MKKKIQFGMVAIALTGMLSGCTFGYVSAKGNNTNEAPFISIVDDEFGYCVLKHNETGVCYLAYSSGGITVMLNPDGTPYIDKSNT